MCNIFSRIVFEYLYVGNGQSRLMDTYCRRNWMDIWFFDNFNNWICIKSICSIQNNRISKKLLGQEISLRESYESLTRVRE